MPGLDDRLNQFQYELDKVRSLQTDSGLSFRTDALMPTAAFLLQAFGVDTSLSRVRFSVALTLEGESDDAGNPEDVCLVHCVSVDADGCYFTRPEVQGGFVRDRTPHWLLGAGSFELSADDYEVTYLRNTAEVTGMNLNLLVRRLALRIQDSFGITPMSHALRVQGAGYGTSA